MTNALDPCEVTGRTRTHVRQIWHPRFAAQPQVVDAFLQLRAAAQRDGIDLLPCASFRPFEAQLSRWNRKFTGRATLYDIDGQPRDYARLSPHELVHAILGWTGLPGASRRHWGTDIDVYDRAAMPPGYHPKLLPQEVAPGGVFARLHTWLDAYIAAFGFFRPYRRYGGGMYPEPWHLSHAASAQLALNTLNLDLLANVIRNANMEGRELVLDMLPELYAGHVINVDPEPATEQK